MIRPAVTVIVAAWLAGIPTAGYTAPLAHREEVRQIVVQEALRSRRVPPSLALAVAEAESDFVADAESPAGARGVMQIMPATGRGEFGVAPDALWEPRLNIRVGIAFLDRLIERYGDRWDLALSHYNGGSRVGAGAAARVIPATRGYVDKVLRLERRNARDETVLRLVTAAEAAMQPASVVERLPTAARAAARLTAAESETRNWRPDQRRRRFLQLAQDALEQAGDRGRQRNGAPGSAGLVERLESQRARFRALLAAAKGAS